MCLWASWKGVSCLCNIRHLVLVVIWVDMEHLYLNIGTAEVQVWDVKAVITILINSKEWWSGQETPLHWIGASYRCDIGSLLCEYTYLKNTTSSEMVLLPKAVAAVHFWSTINKSNSHRTSDVILLSLFLGVFELQSGDKKKKRKSATVFNTFIYFPRFFIYSFLIEAKFSVSLGPNFLVTKA